MAARSSLSVTRFTHCIDMRLPYQLERPLFECKVSKHRHHLKPPWNRCGTVRNMTSIHMVHGRVIAYVGQRYSPIRSAKVIKLFVGFGLLSTCSLLLNAHLVCNSLFPAAIWAFLTRRASARAATSLQVRLPAPDFGRQRLASQAKCDGSTISSVLHDSVVGKGCRSPVGLRCAWTSSR
jgi:hypothetical protein